MNYNRRGGHHEPNRSNTSGAGTSHFHQRTIPEMLAMREDNSASSRRPNKNVRFVEHSSEQAIAPSSPVLPSSNNPFYPPMQLAAPAYEANRRQYGSHQYSSYHNATSATIQRGQMYHDASSQRAQTYHDVSPSIPQRGQMYHDEVVPQHRQTYYEQQIPPRYQPQELPVNQPYYGVPGFYNPSYGSNYGGDMSGSAYECDDNYSKTPPETPHSRVATPRRALHSMSSAATPSTPDSARMALSGPPTSSTVGRKRTASEAVPEVDVESLPTANKQTRFTMESNSGSESKARAARDTVPAIHVFSGPVQRILKWEPVRNKLPMLFEVVAPLKALHSTPTHQELLLRDEAGPVLQVLFYEIDRRMPALQTGQLVRVVGRMTSRARMQAFSVRPASTVERGSMQRISFVCHRAAAQILAPPS